MPKYNRLINPHMLQDPHSAESLGFNQPSGGKKITNIGAVLLPIPTASGGTVTPTTAVGLPALGKSIAVYNTAGTVGYVTLGTTPSLVAGTPGIVANGQAPIPCAPGQYTYIAMGLQQFVIASANTLYVYMIEDGTHLAPESN